MGFPNSHRSCRTGGAMLATCISILCAGVMTQGEEAREKDGGKAKEAKLRFASGRPKLRPLFGKPYEEGVENNKFNDGGEVTVSPHTVKAPKGTTEAAGFDPDPGGVTPPIFNPDPGAANSPNAVQPTPSGPSSLMGGVAPEDQSLEG